MIFVLFCFCLPFLTHLWSHGGLQSVLQVAYNLEYNVSYNSPFTLSELQRCIIDLNVKSAMGQDSFHNSFLYHLPMGLYSVL